MTDARAEDHPKPNWKQRFRARLRDKPCRYDRSGKFALLHQFVLTYDGRAYREICEQCGAPKETDMFNVLAFLSRPSTKSVDMARALAPERGPVWHVTTGSLSALLATDRLYCTRVWFGRYCSGQGRRLEHVSDHEALVHCDRCDRVIADVEYQRA